MDKLNSLIILKKIPNDNVIDYYHDKISKKTIITFSNGSQYSYLQKNVEILSQYTEVDSNSLLITTKQGHLLKNMQRIIMFSNPSGNKFYRIFFESGKHISYRQRDLVISKNLIIDKNHQNFIKYLKSLSEIVGLISEENKNILKEQFDNFTYIRDDSCFSTFFNGKSKSHSTIQDKIPVIFPFGSNSSQMTAVNNALNNNFSVIEGPPGTGKTQTILNIIANLLIRDKTIAVVSNNNFATDNIYEKLQNHGIENVCAQLGNLENKKAFLESDLPFCSYSKSDILSNGELSKIKNEISSLESRLSIMYQKQNAIANLKQELSAISLEKKYYDEYFNSSYEDIHYFKEEFFLSSKNLLSLIIKFQEILDMNKHVTFFFKLKCRFFYSFKNKEVFKKDLNHIIAILKKYFYNIKSREISNEIKSLENKLRSFSFDTYISKLTEKSLKLLMHSLATRYFDLENLKPVNKSVLFQNPHQFLKHYPIILSTTYSIRSSIRDAFYDYVIVDEASQVDLATGTLAMSVAKNIVIVGDQMQLSNIIKSTDVNKIERLSDEFDILAPFRYENHNLLSSVSDAFVNVPKTLLKEHYRCHPKIINFCNKKFYNNELVIMTSDKNESDVLQVIITNEGNHARDHFNQRQIDEITQNLLPQLQSNDLGIISPYRMQTHVLNKELLNTIGVDVSTVHKFQGREKDDIIISTVDNVVSEFIDSPNMLNVAVSRAKNRLCLVVSNNEKNANTNIGDLIKYVRYSNFDVKQSDIFSIFDMLYKPLEKQRQTYLLKHKKVSEYDSENLMASIIKEVLSEKRFLKFDFTAHYQFNQIIRNTCKLTDRETSYTINANTHVDFLIYNTIDNSIALAIEVDGYKYHKEGTKQKERDYLKDTILQKYNIPLIRFNTTGSKEKEKLRSKLIGLTKN